MVQAIITLGKEEDRVVNIVKAQHGFKNKSEAINLIVSKFHELIDEEACPICDDPNRPFKPEYVAKTQGIQKEKGIPFKSIEELKKIIEG